MKGQDRPSGSSRGHLLVVDDDEGVRGLLSRLLRVTGYTVDEAASAEEAADKLARKAPDLILLDLQLPGKSGQDFLKEIRAEPKLRLTPVVMITGAATQARRVQALEEAARRVSRQAFLSRGADGAGAVASGAQIPDGRARGRRARHPRAGEDLVARITRIGDVFDALTTARVYRAAFTRGEALQIMSDEVRKGWWDGRLLEEFRAVLEGVPAEDPRIPLPSADEIGA